MKRWLWAWAFGALLASGAAQAQNDGASGGHGGGQGFHPSASGESLFVSPCGKPFSAAPGEPYPVAAWFKEADRDRDGFLGRDEFRDDAAAFFAVLDRNQDGVIDSDEVRFYEHEIVPEILRGRRTRDAASEGPIILAQFTGGGGGGRGGGHHGGRSQKPSSTPDSPRSDAVGLAPYGLLAEPEPVTAADVAFDGRITLAEFLAAADRRFAALDVQGQGLIALSDLPKTAAQEAASSASR